MLIQGFPNLVSFLGEPGLDDDFCRMTLKFGYIFPLYELGPIFLVGHVIYCTVSILKRNYSENVH